jgi:Ca-activated chloride channel family protein
MTVDVSGSMEALDLSPEFTGQKSLRTVNIADLKTRLDVVKELFAKFVEARPEDLIGLVTFGGFASSRAPLTADHEALVKTLKGVEVPSLSYDSNGQPIDAEETMTAIGDGLMTALSRLKGAEVKSKIVILLSDGMSNTGAVDPDDAAKAAAKMGIKVYTIGVGTHGSHTPFRSRDMFGRQSIAYANMSFDESQLKSIAKKTGARYFGVRDKKGLQAALEEIDSLEKTTLDRTVFQRYREYFPPFLLWGVVLVLVAVSLQMMASRRLV